MALPRQTRSRAAQAVTRYVFDVDVCKSQKGVSGPSATGASDVNPCWWLSPPHSQARFFAKAFGNMRTLELNLP